MKAETFFAEFQCPQHRAMHLTTFRHLLGDWPKVSMPSTSGDASDATMKVKAEAARQVSMPSTSGDASDTCRSACSSRHGRFQCPQHRAMHLTDLAQHIRAEFGLFQCPQHRAMHLTATSSLSGNCQWCFNALNIGLSI